MNRPHFPDFFPADTTPADIQKAFINNLELYKYITALDAYIDWLDTFIDDRCDTCNKILDFFELEVLTCNDCKTKNPEQ